MNRDVGGAPLVRHGDAEPPEPASCWFCDDQRLVDVRAVRNSDGDTYRFPKDAEMPSLPCPACVLRLDMEEER